MPDTFLSAHDPALVNSAGGVIGGNRNGRRGQSNGASGTSTSLLVEYVREEFPGVVIEPVGRKYWNDAGGL